MKTIRAVGFVIYSYGVIEEKLSSIWTWLHRVMDWSGITFSEYCFTPRGSNSYLIKKVTSASMRKLYSCLETQKPWYVVDFGWPTGTLNSRVYATYGCDVTVKSHPQPRKGGERYRQPSYIALIIHPECMKNASDGINGFLELVESAWEAIDGVYGIVDVETGIPPHSDLLHNFDHLLSNLTPAEYFDEFKAWQLLRSRLDSRIWKTFWGNLLNKEHLYKARVYTKNQQKYVNQLSTNLNHTSVTHEVLQILYSQCNLVTRLSGNGLLFTLSESPLDWFTSDVQERRYELDKLLESISLQKGE